MKVLIVDDHPELLQLVAQALRNDDMNTLCVDTAQKALEKVHSQPIDLMILDLGLPEGSGLDVCKAVRNEGRRFPILVLTAQHDVAIRVACLDSGADDYLKKPFAVAELRARVRALLRRAHQEALASHTIGELVIDFQHRQARRGNETAPLTAREWAIVESLARAPGKTLTRPALLASAWPNAKGDKSSSLEVLIGRIRRKLGRDCIETLRNHGYRLGSQPADS